MLGRLSVTLGTAAVLLLLAGCVAAPATSRSTRLPLGIPAPVVTTCEQNAGLLAGTTPTVDIWRELDGIHARVGVGSASAISSGGSTAIEQSLVHCLTIVGGGQPVYPVTSAGRLQQWKYSATVLWPCFSAHDVDLGPVPSRATFLGGDPLKIDPYHLVRAPMTEVQVLELKRDCPLIPAYLKSESG